VTLRDGRFVEREELGVEEHDAFAGGRVGDKCLHATKVGDVHFAQAGEVCARDGHEVVAEDARHARLEPLERDPEPLGLEASAALGVRACVDGLGFIGDPEPSLELSCSFQCW